MRGSRILLDPRLSAPAFREIQLHGCLKYKSLRGYIRILQYFYHSGDQSQTFFNWTQTSLDFLFSSDLAVGVCGKSYTLNVFDLDSLIQDEVDTLPQPAILSICGRILDQVRKGRITVFYLGFMWVHESC